MDVSYYSVLEVSRTSSLSDIRKAYRRLALIWHPDKNPDRKEEAEKKFKEISEAYEVLSDEKKRKIYDVHGKEGLVRGRSSAPRSHRHNHRSQSLFFNAFGPSFFVFKSPEEVFREFFTNDPFAADPFADFFAAHDSLHHQTAAHFHGHFTPNLLYTAPSSMMASSRRRRSPSPRFSSTSTHRRTSTSTRFVNGVKIETKRVFENGIETVTVHEDGQLKSKVVNGLPQTSTNGTSISSTIPNTKAG